MMTHLKSHTLVFKFLTLGILVWLLVIFADSRGFRLRGTTVAQSLNVTVQPQPESPLQIITVSIFSVDARTPHFEFSVHNAGGKPIRAYAIARSLGNGGTRPGGGSIVNLLAAKDILQPGHTRKDSVIGGVRETPVTNISLAVDFVEFTDGTTWGKDRYNTAERLAGQRAGGRAALDHFKHVLAKKGPAPLTDSLESEAGSIPVPQGHSPEWADGFKTGVGVVKVRLKAARQKRGKIEDVEAELERPYDETEGRPE
jgi:hypothetical protein